MRKPPEGTVITLDEYIDFINQDRHNYKTQDTIFKRLKAGSIDFIKKFNECYGDHEEILYELSSNRASLIRFQQRTVDLSRLIWSMGLSFHPDGTIEELKWKHNDPETEYDFPSASGNKCGIELIKTHKAMNHVEKLVLSNNVELDVLKNFENLKILTMDPHPTGEMKVAYDYIKYWMEHSKHKSIFMEGIITETMKEQIIDYLEKQGFKRVDDYPKEKSYRIFLSSRFTKFTITK